MKLNLTAKSIAALRADNVRVDYWDTNLPGFGLRITPQGTKTFSVMYYNSGGRKLRYTIGTTPPLTLADARDKAKDILRSAEKGDDPQQHKVTVRAAGKFGELADIYMRDYAIGSNPVMPRKKSWREDQRQLDAYILPSLKNVKAAAVTIDDVEVLLEAIAKRAPVQANRVRALLQRVYSWALSIRKHRHSFALTGNPVSFIKRPTDEKARERVYSDAELKVLWKTFGQIGMLGDLFKLQLLTATRKGELVAMEWREVDLKRGVWEQPSEKTKNGKTHIVPLSPSAVRVLKSLRQQQDTLKNVSKRNSSFVFFSSRTGAKPMVWIQKAAVRVREKSKITDFQPHDLRRTTATRLAQAGIADNVLKMTLNHSLGRDITGVYNQYRYFEERRAALKGWSTRLLKIVGHPTAV